MGIGTGTVGLISIGLAVLMFMAAKPRHGEVVGFLRGRDNVQAIYTLGIIVIGFFGCALLLASALGQ
jgi:hypothetical protein